MHKEQPWLWFIFLIDFKWMSSSELYELILHCEPFLVQCFFPEWIQTPGSKELNSLCCFIPD